jgi:hypothetical protein
MDKNIVIVKTLDEETYKSILKKYAIHLDTMQDFPYAFELFFNFNNPKYKQYMLTWFTIILNWLSEKSPFKNGLWCSPLSTIILIKDKDLALQFKIAWS